MNEYKFVVTSNPHTSPHKAIVAVQTASDHPTFHYKCILCCVKLILAVIESIGSSNRKEKETIFVYINYMYNRCTVPVCTKRNSEVISLGLKLPLNKTHLN